MMMLSALKALCDPMTMCNISNRQEQSGWLLFAILDHSALSTAPTRILCGLSFCLHHLYHHQQQQQQQHHCVC
jgi:hypothetical protein